MTETNSTEKQLYTCLRLERHLSSLTLRNKRDPDASGLSREAEDQRGTHPTASETTHCLQTTFLAEEILQNKKIIVNFRK